jgi:hypothetical protein
MRRQTIALALLTMGVAVACAAAAEKPAAKTAEAKSGEAKSKDRFLRLQRDSKDTPTALEAAVVHCAPEAGKAGPTVDLVSAVHVADKAYYDEINKTFEGYDVVLYELVAPQGTRIPKGGRKDGDSVVSMVQKAMKDILQLEFQLEAVDYTRKNLVHADMSPEQFSESMRKRNESVWTMFFRMMGYALAKESRNDGKSTDAELLLALFDKNRALALKRLLAEQFEDMEGSLLAIEGPEGSTLVSGRNQVAAEVLRKQIAAGKRKIAIFYGAGHMADLEKRLHDDFGLVPVSTRWLTAWDLKAKK